jgi:hypothetical protein
VFPAARSRSDELVIAFSTQWKPVAVFLNSLLDGLDTGQFEIAFRTVEVLCRDVTKFQNINARLVFRRVLSWHKFWD